MKFALACAGLARYRGMKLLQADWSGFTAGPTHIAPLPLSFEPVIQRDASRAAIGIDVHAAPSSRAYPAPLTDDARIPEQSRLDREDIVPRHVLRLVDPIEDEELQG